MRMGDSILYMRSSVSLYIVQCQHRSLWGMNREVKSRDKFIRICSCTCVSLWDGETVLFCLLVWRQRLRGWSSIHLARTDLETVASWPWTTAYPSHAHDCFNMNAPLLLGLDLRHLALPIEKWRSKESHQGCLLSAVALFLSSFLVVCPLLTSSSLPSGPWFPGNSPWGGVREEWPIHCSSRALAAWH